MLPRAVHTRLALVGLAVLAVAVAMGFLAFRRASSEADAIGRTAELVAVGLDDQALIVALQQERWQALRDGDLEAAQTATDALVAVRAFDEATTDGIGAARSPESPGGYDAVIDRLFDRSGHIDPALLDGAAAARAAVNVDLLHWRAAIVDELELSMGSAGQAELDAARSETNDWSTTLRLSAAPGQAELLETATGADTLTALREAIDDAGAGDRALTATQAWNQAHTATAAVVAEADAQIWGELVDQRDGARREAQLAPLVVAAAALVALLGLFWVGRRWPSQPTADPHEVPLDALVSVGDGTEEAQPDADDAVPGTDEFFGAEPEPVEHLETGPVPVSEAIFADDGPAELVQHDDGELFEEAAAVAGGTGLAEVVQRATAASLRPEDVLVDEVEPGWVDPAVASALAESLPVLIDTSLAHSRRGLGVTVIGAGHELGYLLWVVDEGDGIDDERRHDLNAALGGQVDDEAPPLLHRLTAAGEQVATHGIDIELLAGDDDTTLTRLFLPGRHLLTGDEPADSPTPPSPVATEPSAEPAPHHLPDPLAAASGERLSARLARGVRAPAPRPVSMPQPRPATPPAVRPSVAEKAPQWPVSDVRPLALGDPDVEREMGEDERRAAAARRIVEQYRGGVSAALMDGNDDVVSPRAGRRS